ncbi:MAG: GH3 auxin-responsive promoter family protein, partial [Planctomycetota bacterium]
MSRVVDRIAARLALLHAQRVYGRFVRALKDVERVQGRVLRHVLELVGPGEYARGLGLARVGALRDLQRAAPVVTFEQLAPYIERLANGDTGAMFHPRQAIVMFATSSGTTATPKRIPVTPQFVRDYRRGWNTFGLRLLSDHPRAILRPILQSSGRFDVSRTPGGTPCGAITGLLARTQKRIVRRYYIGRPEIAELESATARYYTSMRLGIVRDVAFAITASPATLIQMARTADEHSEALIRDVHDGTISGEVVDDAAARRALAVGLRPNPGRARELEAIRANAGGRLRPRDYWRLEFLACWTGGSMGYYLERLAAWWGQAPVRDVGLLASEGRVSIPLQDNTPVGVLDVTSAVFEFIPAEQSEVAAPQTIAPRELEAGRDYIVVLTNATGLVRYRLDDVVRVRGFLHQAPLIEFLHRAGRVASIAGEKLTEHQVVAAVADARKCLRIPEFDFVLAPRWDDPPYYRLICNGPCSAELCGILDRELSEQNEEYASRRKSGRLGPLRIQVVPAAAIAAMDQHLATMRRANHEQY